jgi:hypothetical protein
LYYFASPFVCTLRNAARHCCAPVSVRVSEVLHFSAQKIVDKTKITGRFYTPGEEIKT